MLGIFHFILYFFQSGFDNRHYHHHRRWLCEPVFTRESKAAVGACSVQNQAPHSKGICRHTGAKKNYQHFILISIFQFQIYHYDIHTKNEKLPQILADSLSKHIDLEYYSKKLTKSPLKQLELTQESFVVVRDETKDE